ncbi:hypothetical protein [Streptomyces sp. DH12]|uniref:hypothetical protein n=1 Tax=Streptomyces sp. DH12 TaxID=2857010 RepID=UPI001E54CB2D|nr:hypothetical protein [Streptomyces sp. DH12]
MDTRKIALLLVLAGMVFGWSMMMAAMGHVALVATLAPILGLTVTQVLRGFRPQPAPASRQPAAAVAREEDGTS